MATPQLPPSPAGQLSPSKSLPLAELGLPSPLPAIGSGPPVALLYHRGCPDGVASALVALAALTEAGRGVTLSPQDAGAPVGRLSRLQGREVWLLDVCPNLANLRQVMANAAGVLVLDHHATNVPTAAALPDVVHLDQTTCGAVLTWRHCYGSQPLPEWLAHIEELDLYRETLPDAGPLQSLLRRCVRPELLATTILALHRDRPAAVSSGQALFEQRRIEVMRYASTACRGSLRQVPVWSVQLSADSPDIATEVGNVVALERGGICAVWRLRDQQIRYSLRSQPAVGPRVNALAEQFGGGGHRHAAGFSNKMQQIQFNSPLYVPLQAAIAAAQQAGARLHAERWRPGGPRGHGDHADADLEAELLIRKALLAQFPDWHFRGEESGYHAGAPSCTSTWVVDPNDGTIAYLRGWRGSSVSIGLLQDGEPVLGVVFAYAMPDEGGDLIAWAEGCGGVIRNGQPHFRAPLPDAVGPEHTVAVSQAADTAAAENAKCCEPARFLTMPSIAYRLALVAVGEADAGTSLQGPKGWDLIAGHALLRGVGGTLLGTSGEPVRYDNTGNTLTNTSIVIGASTLFARELLARPWAQVQGQPWKKQPLDLVGFRPGVGERSAAVLCRAHGCMLGQLAGDSLGSLVEFRSSASIAHEYPGGPALLADGGTFHTLAGQPTDDSEMALALARSLVHRPKMGIEGVAQAYVAWLESRPFDIGATTRQSLGGVKLADIQLNQASQAATRAANPTSQANGALMRVASLGILGTWLDEPTLENLARADAALTHPHPVCGDASALWALLIARAIRQGIQSKALYEQAVTLSADMDPALHATVLAAGERLPTDFDTHQGWLLIALQNALFHLAQSTPLEVAIRTTVLQGGDTDTNAAICGSLLGAVQGRSALAQQWINRVLTCRPLASTRRPRPRWLWPVDALRLTEQLLVVGRDWQESAACAQGK